MHDVIELQNAIVQRLATSVGHDWDYLLVNFEREVVDGERTLDTLACPFTRQGESWTSHDFQAPYDCCQLLFQLSELMASDDGKTWNTCTLEVESSGRYRFLFSHEPANRLSGKFNDESLFKNYVPQSW